MVYIKRKITSYLKKVINQSPVTLLTGCRQSGKSTLLQKMLANYNYVTLDDLKLREQAINEPELFLTYYTPPLIIDEVQNAPNLLSYIKMSVDKDRTKGSYILTGSQQFSLMFEVHESLAGRLGIASLTPLSIEELYIDRKITIPLWTEIALNGLYPEPNADKKIDPKIWFSRYIESLLNRDIKSNLKKGYLGSYDKFIKLLAIRTSQELNYSDISKELGVSSLTVQSWLTLLERSQIVFRLPPYYKNLGKRITKSHKSYFIDPGLVSYLSGHRTKEQIQDSPMTGALFETLVMCEVIKFFFNKGENPPIYYFRDNHGLEVDLIIELGNKILIAEIKSTSSPGKHHIKSLKQIQTMIPHSKAVLLCNRKEDFLLDKNIKAIHWSKISSCLDKFFKD